MSGSAARSLPATLMLKLPSARTPPVVSTPLIDKSDDITSLEVTGDVTGHGHGATGFDGIDNIVWSNVGI